MKLERHSPSSLNLFAASPAMYVMERILGQKQPVGAIAHRGTAVEHGVAHGLLDLDATPDECIEEALKKYDLLTALSGDHRKDDLRTGIPGMVTHGLDELRPYGTPTRVQDYIEWRPEGLHCPIVGYLDFAWDQHGIITDLKTTEACPSKIRIGHARQVAFYAATDNLTAGITYVTPKKRATYGVENIMQHRAALHRIALAAERFLSLSDDPSFFASIVVPDVDQFYFSPPEVREAAYKLWGI
jgi:PD-(D/E)XK nuclease superfamily